MSKSRIEVYDWPKGSERSTDTAIDLIEGDAPALIPSIGDVILLPAPTEQFREGTVNEDEFFIMRGCGKPYRVLSRELMYSPRAEGDAADAPLSFSNAWLFVRAMTKEEYWGTEP